MAPQYTLRDTKPTVELEMRFKFQGEHALTLSDGSEEQRHSHDYLLVVRVTRPLDRLGFVIKNDSLNMVVRPHAANVLNGAWLHDIIEQPTMERLAVWVWERLQPVLPGLSSVSVSEQKEHGAIATYRGPHSSGTSHQG